MEQKSLWIEGQYGLTQDGSNLEDEALAAFTPIFERYLQKGYSVREISHLIISAVGVTESEIAIRKGVERVKEKQSQRQTITIKCEDVIVGDLICVYSSRHPSTDYRSWFRVNDIQNGIGNVGLVTDVGTKRDHNNSIITVKRLK